MNVIDYISLAERLESLVRRSDTYGKNRGDILAELEDIVDDLRKQADVLDRDIYNRYLMGKA